MPKPKTRIHSSAALGARISPITPAVENATIAARMPIWFRLRAASIGTVNAGTSWMSAPSACSEPASPSEKPASSSTLGSQLSPE